MREHVDAERIRRFTNELGRSAKSTGTLYLVGGATAVLEGWRESTVDIDLRLEPEADDVLRRIAELKEELDVNVELASPPDFIPELPGWRDRSPFVGREGNLDIRQFDPYSQALAKVERGFAQDLEDVAAMLERGLVDAERACVLFGEIEPELHRYPAIDGRAFRRAVERAFHC
jgi:hypothetical protein